MNEKVLLMLVKYEYKNYKVETFKILVIEKTKLLTEDQNQVAENAKVIDPCLP
jgi:hypothetical protein